MYETFEHTADLGLRVRAPDLNALFADAARGLFAMIVPELASVCPNLSLEFTLESTALDLLLFDWLNELLYTYETQHLLLVEFDVRIDGDRLTATAHGEALDRSRHELDHEVKAITYHKLRVERQSDGWLAEVIVDI